MSDDKINVSKVAEWVWLEGEKPSDDVIVAKLKQWADEWAQYRQQRYYADAADRADNLIDLATAMRDAT